MNGFYPMLNDVHDKAVKDLPLAECALFEHLWRKLIGWKQWSDDIAISQLDEEISGSRATILRLLKKLEDKRWIIVTRTDGITNNIGIPKCPGIKMRLGVDPYQNDTSSRIKMTLVPVSEEDGYQYQNDTHNRQLLQTSPKDSLQTNNDHDLAPPPENADAERQDMICDALKKAIGGHPNTITLVSNSYQLEAFNALMEYPDEKILHVIQSSGEKGKLHQDNAITYTKNGLDHWDAWYAGKAGGNGGSVGDIRRAKEADELTASREYLAELIEQRAKCTDVHVADIDVYIEGCKADIAELERKNGY